VVVVVYTIHQLIKGLEATEEVPLAVVVEDQVLIVAIAVQRALRTPVLVEVEDVELIRLTLVEQDLLEY
jgi:hypothetical protein